MPPSINGELLDDLEELLREHTEPGQELNSGQLAARLGIDEDHDTNPKTREAVNILREERGVPILSNHNGYAIIQTTEDLEQYIERLDGQIAGLQEQKREVVSSWNQRVGVADGGMR